MVRNHTRFILIRLHLVSHKKYLYLASKKPVCTLSRKNQKNDQPINESQLASKLYTYPNTDLQSNNSHTENQSSTQMHSSAVKTIAH